MKNLTLLLLFGLLMPALPRLQESGSGDAGQEEKEQSDNLTTRYFEGEAERLDADAQGSWILYDYSDPLETVGVDTATGFATFQDGYLTMILAIDSIEALLFKTRQRTLINTGAYRYRFDEMGSLQLSSLMSFSNQTSSGNVGREPSTQSYEYFAQISDGVLELRNPDGVQLSFRRMGPGDFPESAIRRLDARRANVDHWEIREDR